MKPELIAALTALASIQAARLNAWAAHHACIASGGNGLQFNPYDMLPYEADLQVWVDEQLAQHASARNEENHAKVN